MTDNQSNRDLRSQLEHYLEAMRTSGIEWLPKIGTETRCADTIPMTKAPASSTIPMTKAPVSSPPPPPTVVLTRTPATWTPVNPAPTPVVIPNTVGSLFSELDSTPVEVPLAPEERRKELTVLADKIKGCFRCPELVSTRTQTVFGVGPIDPDLCFIGEAPGADEDRTGEPFVGAAGRLLDRIIEACGLQRREVYICNILKCRPPGNRQPKSDECANCRDYLERQISLIRPKYICALGATAAQRLLKTSIGITKLRGSFYEFNGIPVMCTFHPASLLPGRSPENKRLVWEDMKMLLTRMGKPIPGPKNPRSTADD